ncbi:MAG: arginase family protein [Pseudomonadota bacterium]
MTEKPDLGALFGASDVSTFMGLAACDDLASLDAPAVIIGAPGATPYRSVGAYCAGAPAALRASAAGLAANIDRHNFDLGGPIYPPGAARAVDVGDLPFESDDFAANRAAIQRAMETILSRGAVPILLGGDDSVPIPMLAAFAGGGPFTILQIDAHIDWRREHMGEPLGLSSTMRRASEMAHIERIVQVGARGIGSAHSDDVRDALDWGAVLVLAEEVHRGGVEAALRHIPEGSQIIIAFDVDALDPSIMPGAIGRTPGGFSYFQVLDLLRGAAAKGRIAGIDVVEYMPEVDVDGIGAMNVSRLIAAMLGLLARQDAQNR